MLASGLAVWLVVVGLWGCWPGCWPGCCLPVGMLGWLLAWLLTLDVGLAGGLSVGLAVVPVSGLPVWLAVVGPWGCWPSALVGAPSIAIYSDPTPWDQGLCRSPCYGSGALGAPLEATPYPSPAPPISMLKILQQWSA